MKIFIDNDVVLDVLLKRKNFTYSFKLFALIEEKKLEAYTSPIVLVNSFYISHKLQNKEKAWAIVKKIRMLLKILPINERITDYALASEFSDFEDAIQFYCAKLAGCSYLVTRNKPDYPQSDLVITSPEEFLGVIKTI